MNWRRNRAGESLVAAYQKRPSAPSLWPLICPPAKLHEGHAVGVPMHNKLCEWKSELLVGLGLSLLNKPSHPELLPRHPETLAGKFGHITRIFYSPCQETCLEATEKGHVLEMSFFYFSYIWFQGGGKDNWLSATANVAQLVENHSVHWRVADLIPCHGICPSFGFDPW